MSEWSLAEFDRAIWLNFLVPVFTETFVSMCLDNPDLGFPESSNDSSTLIDPGRSCPLLEAS